MKTKNCVQQEVEQKYLMTVDEFEKKMKDKPNGSKEYKKFLSQEIGVHRPGMWIVYDNDLSDVSDVLYIWLVGGNIAYFRDDGCGIIRGCSDCMVSGRLLKN